MTSTAKHSILQLAFLVNKWSAGLELVDKGSRVYTGINSKSSAGSNKQQLSYLQAGYKVCFFPNDSEVNSSVYRSAQGFTYPYPDSSYMPKNSRQAERPLRQEAGLLIGGMASLSEN